MPSIPIDAKYTITIPPNFSISLSPASWTLDAGQSVGVQVTVAPQAGFTSQVSFTCSSNVECVFSPQTVTPGKSLVNWTTMTVTTNATSASLHRNSSPFLPVSTLAAILCCVGWKRRRSLQIVLLLAVSLAGLGLLSGCGGGGAAKQLQPTQESVTVTGTAGSLTNSTTLTLTVYPTL